MAKIEAIVAASGSSGVGPFTAGSIPFSDGVDLIDDNANLYWDDTNNRLGLGTTLPQNNLHIKSSTDASIWLEADSDDFGEQDNAFIKITQDNNDTRAIFGFNGNSGDSPEYPNLYTGTTTNSLLLGTIDFRDLHFGTDNNVRMTVHSNGRVGIGENVPDTLLHLKSTGDVAITLEADTDNVGEGDNVYFNLIQDGGATNALIGFVGSAGESPISGTFYTNTLADSLLIGSKSTTPIQFGIDDVVYMTLDNSGNFGIRTNTPDDNFHVLGEGLFSHADLGVVQIAPGGGPRINWGATTDKDSLMILGAYGGINSLDCRGRDLHIFTGSFNPGLYLDQSASKLGLGTTSPAELFHIHEDATDITSRIRIESETGQAALELRAGSDATQFRAARVDMYNIKTSVNPVWTIINDFNQNGTDDLWIYPSNDNAKKSIFYENGDFSVDSSTFFVDASSNSVGIGDTLPQAKLEVNGNQTINVAALYVTSAETEAGANAGAEPVSILCSDDLVVPGRIYVQQGLFSGTGNIVAHATDTNIADIEARGDSQGTGRFFAGQSKGYGGGFYYNGDDNPNLPGATDHIVFYRRFGAVDTAVMEFGNSDSNTRIYGNLSIGQDYVQRALNVAPDSGAAYIALKDTTDDDDFGIEYYDSTNTLLYRVGSNSQDYLAIETFTSRPIAMLGGKVGIGLSNPAHVLHVTNTTFNTAKFAGNTSGGANFTGNIIELETNTPFRANGIMFTHRDTVANDIWFVGTPRGTSGFQIGQANQLALNDSGAMHSNQSALFITEGTKYIGISTSGPITNLDINGTLNVNYGIIQRGGSKLTGTSDLGLYSQVAGNAMRFVTSSGDIVWYTGGGIGTGEKMRLKSSGNLGLDVVSPQDIFHVNLEGGKNIMLSTEGGIANNEDIGGIAWKFINGTGNEAGRIWVRGNPTSTTSGTTRLSIGAHGNGPGVTTEQLTIQSSGDIGINEPEPQTKLHIVGADFSITNGFGQDEGIFLIPSNPSDVNGGGRIFFKENSNDSYGCSIGYNGGATSDILNWTGNTFNISMHNGTSLGVQVMTIRRDNYRVGFGGNATPSTLVHALTATPGEGGIFGNAFLGNWYGSSDYTVFTHSNFRQVSNSYALLQQSDGDTFLNCVSGKKLSLREGNVDTMVLYQQKVGIGTNAPTDHLHIRSAGDASIKIEADTNNSGESDNPYIRFIQDGGLIDGTIGFTGDSLSHPYDPYTSDQQGTLPNSLYIGNDGNNNIQFSTHLTVRMTINGSGRVGIGTNAPQSSSLLDLSSTTGALTVPRMTTTQRNALNDVPGMIIYNTTTGEFNFREVNNWVIYALI